VKLPALGACVAIVCCSSVGRAAPNTPCDVEGVWCGPVVPTTLAREPRYYFSVALGAEHRGSETPGTESLLALATTLRLSAFAPYLQLMAKPTTGSSDYEESRILLGSGLRAYARVFGAELGYGAGVAAELRAEDHFWLAYATPIELSAVVYRRRSFEIELFAGVRRAFAGSLVNSFLLDPNGFHNEQAQAELDRATGQDAWHGFIRLMIARRVD
jgi:hypothetical protein